MNHPDVARLKSEASEAPLLPGCQIYSAGNTTESGQYWHVFLEFLADFQGLEVDQSGELHTISAASEVCLLDKCSFPS